MGTEYTACSWSGLWLLGKRFALKTALGSVRVAAVRAAHLTLEAADG